MLKTMAGIITIPCHLPVSSGGINLGSLREMAQEIGILTTVDRKSKRELCMLLNNIEDPAMALEVARMCDNLGIEYQFSVQGVEESDTKMIDGKQHVAVQWVGFEEKTYEPLENVRHIIDKVSVEKRTTRGSKVLELHKKCLEQYVLGELIGVGATSSVYHLGKDKVVKIVTLNQRYDADDFETEAKFQREMSDLGLAATYIKHFICNHFGYLIMNYWQTLDKVKGRDIVKKKLGDVLKKLKDAGVVHGDLRAPNIGVKYDGDQHITDLVLLDWGKAFRLRDFSGKALEKRVKDAKESLGMGKKKIADAYEIDGLMLEQLFIE